MSATVQQCNKTLSSRETNETNETIVFPLHDAAAIGDTQMVRQLVQSKKVGLNGQNHCGDTPVMLAAKHGFLHCVKFLISSKADLTLVNKQNQSCLQVCSTSKGFGCIRAIRLALEGKVEKRVRIDGKWKTLCCSFGEASDDIQNSPGYEKRSIFTTMPGEWEKYRNKIERDWIELSSPPESLLNFRVVTYNILAQCYTRPGYFPWATEAELSWEFRSKALLKELLSYEADILCLQEVDHYPFLCENLPMYTGLYKQRTGSRKEGCAIFFLSTKFSLIERKDVEFNALTSERKVQKDNIALFATLCSLDTHETICIGTSHFYYKSVEARNHQAANFVKIGEEMAPRFPLLLCGDFNCMPHAETISFFREKGLKHAFESLVQQNKFASFFGGRNAKKWYDFLFTSPTLIPVRLLSLPMHGATVLPNSQFSSDHIALLADFTLTFK